MEIVIFLVIIAFLSIILFIKGLIDSRINRRRYISSLMTDYGKKNIREYKDGEYERIGGLHRVQQLDSLNNSYHVIDDITWRDLDMDIVFQSMNYTQSSVGQEYLYHMLRTPKLNQEGLEEQEEVVEYLQYNANDRSKLQEIYYDLGRTGKYSIYDYMSNLSNIGDYSNMKNYIMIILYIPAILLLMIYPGWGLLAIVVVAGLNIVDYYNKKASILPYITTFSYILRVINACNKLKKVKIPIIEKQISELSQLVSTFKSFKFNSYILMSVNSASGSPLDILLDYIRMLFHIDIIKFNSMLKFCIHNRLNIDRLLVLVGMLDSYMAIGEYRVYLGNYCIPIFHYEKYCSMKGMYHPLIKDGIKNDIIAKNGVLITGSNASGKSTFLKGVGINSILASTINTCACDEYSGRMYRVYTSMAIRDSILDGESYYMAEIRSIKRVLDALDVIHNNNPILCIVDEVLRGTNTVERIAASTQILKYFVDKGAITFAATHDIELVKTLDYENYHFREELIDGDIVFPYKLYKDCVSVGNAIRLLDKLGFDKEITVKARELANRFNTGGSWI